MGQHADSRSRELTLHRRKIVLHCAPLRRQDGSVPGIVNVTEAELGLGVKIVVNFEKLLPPVSAGRNVGIEARTSLELQAPGAFGKGIMLVLRMAAALGSMGMMLPG